MATSEVLSRDSLAALQRAIVRAQAWTHWRGWDRKFYYFDEDGESQYLTFNCKPHGEPDEVETPYLMSLHIEALEYAEEVEEAARAAHQLSDRALVKLEHGDTRQARELLGFAAQYEKQYPMQRMGYQTVLKIFDEAVNQKPAPATDAEIAFSP